MTSDSCGKGLILMFGEKWITVKFQNAKLIPIVVQLHKHYSEKDNRTTSGSLHDNA